MAERDMIMAVDSMRFKVKFTVTDIDVTWYRFVNHILHTAKLTSRQILSARVNELKDRSTIDIHYVNVVANPIQSVTLECAFVTFVGSTSKCQDIEQEIADLLKRRENHRPTRVLLFMNPMSGNKDSGTQYRKIVAPIFELCGVTVHAIETENSDHAKEVMSDYDLSLVDVVVSMGGDGSVTQVLTALLAREVKDAGVDMDDPDATVIKPSTPLGIIPCGSGMALSIMVNRSLRIETATLNIVLGQTVSTDILIIRNHAKFVGYGCVMENVGVMANVFSKMERNRWLGKSRYRILYAPLMWWYWQNYDIEVQYKPVSDEMREFELSPELQTVEEKVENDKGRTTSDGPLPGWKTYRGPTSGVTVIPWKLMDFIHYLGMKQLKYKKPQISSGKALLAIEKQDTFVSSLLDLRDVTERGRRNIPRANMEQVEITECRITGVNKFSISGDIMCHDGDVIPLPYGPNVHIKVFQDALNVICIDDDLIADRLRWSRDAPV